MAEKDGNNDRSHKNNISVSPKVADRVYPPQADYGGTESIIFSPLHCSGDFQDRKNNQKMQNKPNFTITSHMPTSHNGPRATSHESRLMQNEPNLQNLMYLKVPKRTQFQPSH